MSTRMDEYLRASGYRVTAPRPRVAVSPRVRQETPPRLGLRHLGTACRWLGRRLVCAWSGHRWERSDGPYTVKLWSRTTGEYVTQRQYDRRCVRCDSWRTTRPRFEERKA